MAKTKFKQIHLNLSPQVYEQLQEMKQEMGAPTIGEVIRRSVSIARSLEKEQRQGGEVVVRHPNSKVEKILVRI